MEKPMNCPICGAVNIREYLTEDVGLVEEYYYCKNCGYFSEMAYSPVHEGITPFLSTKFFSQLRILWKNRKKIHGLKFDKCYF